MESSPSSWPPFGSMTTLYWIGFQTANTTFVAVPILPFAKSNSVVPDASSNQPSNV